MSEPDQLPALQSFHVPYCPPDHKAVWLEDALTAIAAERARADALQAELDLRRKSGSTSERLHNLCESIAAEADGSEWSREEWNRIDAENLALRKRADALEAALRRWSNAAEVWQMVTERTHFASEGETAFAELTAARDAARALLKPKGAA